LPDGWEWKKLGDLTTTTSGGTPKRNEKSYWGGNIGWLKSGELNDGYITNVEEYITKEGLAKSSAKLFPKGTLLIAMYGATVGKLGLLEIETTTNQAICGILNDKNKFETLFMFYYFKKIRAKMIEDSFGGAQPNLSQTYIKDLDIPLPPLEEQKRIVSKLDTLFEKIDKSISLHQKNIDEANVFMASVLNDVFVELEEKYGKKIWNDVLTIKNGKHYKDVIDENGKYPIYGSGGIMNYANQYICNEDTVIIGRKGTINNPIFVKEKFWNIDTAFGIEAKREFLSPMFLFYFTKKFNFLDLNKSTTLPSLAKTHLLQIKMVVPPLQTQQKVVAYLDEISQKLEKIKQLQKEKMAHLKALKASILDRAFRGEL